MKKSANLSQAPKKRIAEAAYDAIENLIATLALEPNQPIVESELVRITGFGRTPVREALMQLVANGLIEQQPRRGMRVSEIRIAEHLVLIETRRVLERLIARASARRATQSQKESLLKFAQEMVKSAEKQDLSGYMNADQSLDRVNHQACRNPYAVSAVVPMIVQCRRFWYAFQHDGDMGRGAAAHLTLAKGIYQGDADLASEGADALMDYLAEFTHKVIEV